MDSIAFLDFVLDNIKKIFYPEQWIDLDLSLSKSEILAMLVMGQYGEMTMSQIAEDIHVSMSTATGIIDRLVKKKYLKRERSESDRRVIVLQFTEQGKDFIENLKGTIFSYIKRIDAVLTEEEKNVIFHVFQKVVKAIDQPVEEAEETSSRQVIKKIEIE